jgi:hypothetical protein
MPRAAPLTLAPVPTLALALLAALLAALAGCADTGAASPVCSRPQVLGLVSERLRTAGIPPDLEPASIGQAPGPRPGIVLCSVWVRTDTFDTPRRGEAPARRLVAYQYRLQLGRNVAFLLPDPAFTPVGQ